MSKKAQAPVRKLLPSEPGSRNASTCQSLRKSYTCDDMPDAVPSAELREDGLVLGGWMKFGSLLIRLAVLADSILQQMHGMLRSRVWMDLAVRNESAMIVRVAHYSIHPRSACSQAGIDCCCVASRIYSCPRPRRHDRIVELACVRIGWTAL